MNHRQPVHALIFLFRYRAQDEQTNGATSCPDHVWFANQIPDFACATVALINIVNNVPGLNLGPELREFKNKTRGMDPIARGDAVDQFDFLRRIHNSFATETDLLNADMHLKNKLDRFKKKLAAKKASATRAANKALNATKDDRSTPSSMKDESDRANKRAKRATNKPNQPDDKDFVRRTDDKKEDNHAESKEKIEDPTTLTGASTADPPRRSARQPKPRQDVLKTNTADTGDEEESGYHFIAFMPIDGHVWRLDGLDYFPRDLGVFGEGTDEADGGSGNWLHVAQTAMAQRMAQFEGGDGFNVMAVVHDPAAKDREELAKNIATIQALDHHLDTLAVDWRDMEGAETSKEAITGLSEELAVSLADIAAAEGDIPQAKQIASCDDILKLLPLRREVLLQQAPLRGAVRDAKRAEREDAEEARHRRHDYNAFTRAWLHALAEAGSLADMMNGE